jgi:hypothetical protein
MGFAQQTEQPPNFPNQKEINLLVVQAERATDTYKVAIEAESREYGNNSNMKAAIEKDRQVLVALQTSVSALKKDPTAFNSAVAFYFVIWLDDASRNAAICASTAINDSFTVMAASGNLPDAYSHLSTGQECLSASNLLNTVAESATELYGRFLEANESLLKQSFETVQFCTKKLKGEKTERPAAAEKK